MRISQRCIVSRAKYGMMRREDFNVNYCDAEISFSFFWDEADVSFAIECDGISGTECLQ